mmetsp:Transcript_6742/g.15397  ORF Transcript_6742/g.15397 Transcript_6742/m.15397 type:complete len:170 (-) Transcript_6742:60-569(-)
MKVPGDSAINTTNISQQPQSVGCLIFFITSSTNTKKSLGKPGPLRIYMVHRLEFIKSRTRRFIANRATVAIVCACLLDEKASCSSTAQCCQQSESLVVTFRVLILPPLSASQTSCDTSTTTDNNILDWPVVACSMRTIRRPTGSHRHRSLQTPAAQTGNHFHRIRVCCL